MTLKCVVTNKYRNDDREVTVYNDEALTMEGQFLCELIVKWGMVSGYGYEGSQGHPQLQLLTPSEVVDRAEQITQLAFSKIRQRDWIKPVADLAQANGLEPWSPTWDNPDGPGAA